MHIGFTIWLVSLALPLALAALIAVGANAQWGAQHSAFALIFAGSLALLYLAMLGVHLLRRAPQREPGWFPLLTLVLGCALPLAPAITRCTLPWEDPVTYQGSPLAALIGVVVLGALAIPQVAAGAALIACFAWRRQNP